MSHYINQFFLLKMKSTSGLLLWISVIVGRGAGCLTICKRVGIGLPGTTPDDPENYRYIKALWSGVVGPNC